MGRLTKADIESIKNTLEKLRTETMNTNGRISLIDDENIYEAINAVDKLAYYEDLEEQNRLIELPCAVGDTVWEIDEYAEGFKVRPMTVLSIELKKNKGYVYATYSDEHDVFARGYGLDDFGEILFLTKEEAEAKLEELKGETA